MSEKIELPPHIFVTNDRGLIEAIDIMTGKVLVVQSTEADILAGKAERVTRIETPEGPVFIESTLNFDMVGRLKPFPYSKLLADLICEHIVNGGTLPSACEQIKVPYSVVCAWRRNHPEFVEQLALARRDGAEYMHGELLETARASRDAKTQIDALKWAAEKNDPERFGQRTKISGDPNAPIGFTLISTGINRDVTPPPEKIEGQAPELGESQSSEVPLEEIKITGGVVE